MISTNKKMKSMNDIEEYVIRALSSFPKEYVDILLKDQYFMREIAKIFVSEKKEEERIKKVKKKAYYYLRRYRIGDIDVSSVERGEKGAQELSELLSNLIEELQCDVIIDVGCGFFPMTVVEWTKKPSIYYAIDKSREIIDKLSEFSAKLDTVKLIPTELDIRNLESLKSFVRKLHPPPCIALYSRILHSIYRIRRMDPLTLITIIPSKATIILEPKVSLVRREDIRAREKAFLHKIADRALRLGFIYRYNLLELSEDVGVILYFN